jgi:hypothetical protein
MHDWYAAYYTPDYTGNRGMRHTKMQNPRDDPAGLQPDEPVDRSRSGFTPEATPGQLYCLHLAWRLDQIATNFTQLLWVCGELQLPLALLPACQTGRLHLFEVDSHARLAVRLRRLRAAGQRLPMWHQHVPAQATDPRLPELLAAAGVRTDEPILVILAGLLYCLPPVVARRLLTPAWLRCAAGTTVLFDYGPVLAEPAHTPPGLAPAPPLPAHAPQLAATLYELGYQRVEISPLANTASQASPILAARPALEQWLTVEATL